MGYYSSRSKNIKRKIKVEEENDFVNSVTLDDIMIGHSAFSDKKATFRFPWTVWTHEIRHIFGDDT